MRFLLSGALVAALLLAAAPVEAKPRRVHKLRISHHTDPRPAVKRVPKRRVARTSTLAATWGCSEVGYDRAPISNAPQVKVVYAYPAGVSSQLTTGFTYADLIEADAQAVADKVAAQSNGKKSIRFDVGGMGNPGDACTTDSNNRLDIQSVQLDQPASAYLNDTFEQLFSELQAKLVPANPEQKVNYLVYLDNVGPNDLGIVGQGERPADTTHGYANAANQGRDGRGRLFAMLYGAGGNDFFGDSGLGDSGRRIGFLHELSHTLGAVQENAPHSSGAAHCYDGLDIMCYDDGGPYFASGGGSGSMAYPCTGSGFSGSWLDCNHDDYFSASPAPGSYLDQNWNEFDSVFLCAVAKCEQSLTPPNVGLQVSRPNGRLTLTATSDKPIDHYEWNVNGDGLYELDSGSDPILVPRFEYPRSAKVEVRAVAADGTFGYASVPLTPTDPTPSLSVHGDLVAGAPLTLDGSATQDPDGLIEHFVWDTNGDGTFETDTGTNRTATASFAQPGRTQVGLEVQTSYAWSRTVLPLTIAAPPALPPLGQGPQSATPPSVSARLIRLRKLASHGLPLTVKCGAICAVNFTLSVEAKTAKKLRLKTRRGRPVVIARLRGQFVKGTVRPVMRLTPAAARALGRARAVKATLKGSVLQNGVNPLTISKPLSFRR